MHRDLDLLTALGIVDAERARELWLLVGTAAAALFAALALGMFLYRFREPLMRAASGLLKPRNLVPAALFAAAVIYGSNKVQTPQTHPASFAQTGSSVVDPVAGLVEYWMPPGATNEVDVALFGGAFTNSFDFLDGQFLYAYDATTSAGSYQNPTNNPLWCRHNSHSNWTASTLDRAWTPDGVHAACVASLPGGVSPASYLMWFIGPESSPPPVVVEVTGGIEITLVVITSSSVAIHFTGTDARLAQGSHEYHLQYRERIDGVLTEWQTAASATLSGGQVSGVVGFTGYTVDRYREYRVYTDLEVSE